MSNRDQKLIDGMESAAARLLPKPPGLIFPGWFWEEWVLAGGVVTAIALIGFLIWLL